MGRWDWRAGRAGSTRSPDKPKVRRGGGTSTDLGQRIGGGEVVVLDGATGTELERREVPMDDAAWCAAALGEVAEGSAPVGAYPHAGRFVMPNWHFTDEISPEGFTSQAEEWVASGARVVGGCCGIGPEHVRVLRERLPAKG